MREMRFVLGPVYFCPSSTIPLLLVDRKVRHMTGETLRRPRRGRLDRRFHGAQAIDRGTPERGALAMRAPLRGRGLSSRAQRPPRSFGVSQKGRGVTSETGKLVQAYNTGWLAAPTGGLRLAQVPRAAVAHTPARVVTFWFPATLI